MMEQDKIISEVRKAREELSARFGHDLEKLVAFFQQEEKKSKSKLINFQNKKKKTSTS
jgi:hypothetical protein